MLQVLVVCDSFHFIFNYLHHIRLDLGVVAVNLLLHDVVAILVLELVDDGYLLVSLCFRRYLFTIDNNPCVENLLVNFFPEVVCHTAHECALREVGNLGCRYQRIQLRVNGSGCVLPVNRDGLSLLEYFAKTLRQAFAVSPTTCPENIFPTVFWITFASLSP